MKRKLMLFIFMLFSLGQVFPQNNNYLINDLSNLIEARNRMAIIYPAAFKFDYELTISDNYFVYRPILNVDKDGLMGMGIQLYLMIPTITFMENNENIIGTIISRSEIIFNMEQLLMNYNFDEKDQEMIKMFITGMKSYSEAIINNDGIFNIFVKANVSNIPVKPENIETIVNEKGKVVRYIWLGNEELYDYIGRNDCTITSSKWYIAEE